MKVGFNFIQVPNFPGISNYAQKKLAHSTSLAFCLSDSLQLTRLSREILKSWRGQSYGLPHPTSPLVLH